MKYLMVLLLATSTSYAQLEVKTNETKTNNSDIVLTIVADKDWAAQVRETKAENPEKVIAYIKARTVLDKIEVYIKRTEIKKEVVSTVLRYVEENLYVVYSVVKQRIGYNDVYTIIGSDGTWKRTTLGGWESRGPMEPMFDKRILPPSWGGTFDGRLPTGQGNIVHTWKEKRNYATDTYFWFSRNRPKDSGDKGKTGEGSRNSGGK
jgi:hypothetical protein